MLHTQTTTQHQSVMVDPTIHRYQTAIRLIIVDALLWILIGILLIAGYKLNNGPTWLPFVSSLLIYIGFMSLIALITMIPQGRYWKRQERRRQEAAQGAQALLAAEQPAPDANALTLPITIEQRPNRMLLLIPALIAVLAIVFAFSIVYIYPQSLSPHHSVPQSTLYAIAAVAFIALALLGGLLFFVTYYRVRQQITVTQDGILMLGVRKVHSMRWDEVLLFAIDGMYNTKKVTEPFLFELSSANEVIRWNWLRKSTRRIIFLAKPAVPRAEYERQMQALNSLIAARTGLPLYDLREKRHK